jgi:hypothetical protein
MAGNLKNKDWKELLKKAVELCKKVVNMQLQQLIIYFNPLLQNYHQQRFKKSDSRFKTRHECSV